MGVVLFLLLREPNAQKGGGHSRVGSWNQVYICNNAIRPQTNEPLEFVKKCFFLEIIKKLSSRLREKVGHQISYQ